jgi:hypothetical protein
MPAPLVGIAVAAAAKMAAKKLATKAVKKATIKKVAMTPKQAALKKRAAVKPPVKPPVKANETIKIKSGGDIKPAFPKKAKPMSYSQLKDMPNLIKIDSAKGNKVKKIAYRRRTSN